MVRHPLLRNRRRLALLATCALAFSAADDADAAKRRLKIGFVVDGPKQGEPLEQSFVRAIAEVTKGEEAEILLPKEKRRTGDWSPASVRAEVDRLFNDADVDIVITLGWLASNEVVQRASIPKPTFAVHVLDADLQGLDSKKQTSGKKNLSYIVTPGVLRSDLEGFKRLVPGLRKIAIVASKNAVDGIPRFAEFMTARAREAGLEAVIVPVRPADVDGSLQSVPADVQGAYVLLVDDMLGANFDRLAAGLNSRKLPTFSLRGRPEVEKGLLATLSAKNDETQKPRRVAVNILRISSGEDPSVFPVALSRSESLLLNMGTARTIGFAPAFALLNEAEVLGAGAEGGGSGGGSGRKVSMRSAAEDAIKANLDLLADGKKVESGEERVAKARALLLPNIEVTATGAMIDADRANSSLGLFPERSIAAEIVGKQIIFAEKAWANLSIQGDIQKSREERHEIKRLDIAVEAASAYVNVLRAATLERVVAENLKKSRGNLDLTRTRSSAGSAGAAEVYRWEAQIAIDRKEVIKANGQRMAAEMQLNRMIHRPLEEAFALEATSLDGEELVITPAKLAPYIENPRAWRLFREFLVAEALARSPEVRALDAAVAALDRAVTSGKASLFIPNIGVEGRFRQVLVEGGQGSDPPVFPPPLRGFIGVPEDDTTWSVGVQLSLPIFTGFSDWAELNQREADLGRRQAERAAAAEKIEQRVRTMAVFASASFSGIRLSRDAADAAKKALDLVTGAYAEGAIGVVDLLDAQNAALLAEQGAVAANYEFILDQLNVQRAVAWLAFLDPTSADEFFNRARVFFETHQNDVRE